VKNLFWGVVTALPFIFTTVIAGEHPRAMIVFDASGSMWGQISGKPKIEIAREVLQDVLSKWNPDTDLGLTVYGHRFRGDCNDIQTLIPISKVNKNRMIKAVMSIQPKGKTPISKSLRIVADEMKYTEESSTVILISDGKETCDPDPCGTAKQLRKEGMDFVVHVIGFDVDKKTDKELECIAAATGGSYYSPKNAAALNQSMKKIVAKVEKMQALPEKKVKKMQALPQKKKERAIIVPFYIERLKIKPFEASRHIVSPMREEPRKIIEAMKEAKRKSLEPLKDDNSTAQTDQSDSGKKKAEK